jgi:hypothetical protein
VRKKIGIQEYIMTKLRIFVTVGAFAAFIAVAGIAAHANKNDAKLGSGTTTIQQGGTGTSNSPAPRPITTSTSTH